MNDIGKHSNHKLSKYHYHLKSDKVYGDKKLKLCGKCIMPNNLSNDLRQLNRLTRNANQEDDDNPPIVFNDHLSIDFEVLDLTAERQSGLNLPIVFLPNDLFNFKQLKRLHLDCNLIKSLPDALGDNLVNLEILTISSNSLHALPKTLSKLKKLSSFHLANNEFKQFPEVLCSLTCLRFLDLSSNRLETVSNSIGNLKNLESLILFQNQIQTVPKVIGKLENLRTLWLGNNKLSRLPVQITQLKNLDWDEFNLSSNIDGNPLIDPPLEVCVKGMHAINEYFNNKQN